MELKHAIKLLAGGLETKVSDGGSNFSMGQRYDSFIVMDFLCNAIYIVLLCKIQNKYWKATCSFVTVLLSFYNGTLVCLIKMDKGNATTSQNFIIRMFFNSRTLFLYTYISYFKLIWLISTDNYFVWHGQSWEKTKF